SPADFGIHMIVHMTLNMLIPSLLVGGGPITLLLRATTGTGRLGRQIHARVNQLIAWKGLRMLLHPLFVFVVYVASYYALYLTPLFGEIIRYHWGHQLMNVHFIIVGYMFFSLVVGVDKLPIELPHIGRLGYVIAAMPFHAFFGIVLMMTNTPVAQNFYRTLDLPWLDIAAEQYFAGGIAWAGGELPLLGVVIVLAVQWTKQDKRDARRFDRHEDAGLSDEFSAYNDMLRKLAERDGVVAADSESDAAADSVASSADSSAEAGPETAANTPAGSTNSAASSAAQEGTNERGQWQWGPCGQLGAGVGTDRRGRYRHHRDEVHRLRPSGREVVEPHRRSQRVGELRDRTRSRHRPRRPRGGPGRGEEGRLRGTGPQTRRRCLVPTRRRGAAELPAPTPHPRHRPHRAAHGRHSRARAGRGVAVPRLGMGLRPRGPADRDVGRLAVPPLSVEEPGQPHDEHGHPGVPGHHRRLRLGGGDRGLRLQRTRCLAGIRGRARRRRCPLPR